MTQVAMQNSDAETYDDLRPLRGDPPVEMGRWRPTADALGCVTGHCPAPARDRSAIDGDNASDDRHADNETTL